MSALITNPYTASVYIPTDISLVEQCDGYVNIYTITRKGNLSWNIDKCEEEIEEDEHTIFVPSSMIQQLFSRNVKICQIGHSVIAFKRNSPAIFIRLSKSNVSTLNSYLVYC
jgi:hypothetical protein